jgi:hypothetical protein
MRRSFVLLGLLVSLGCGSDADQRREISLDLLSARAEDEGARQRLVTAIEKSDAQSLKTPTLVTAAIRAGSDNDPEGRVSVEWVASQPLAHGIRITFSDSSHVDILFDDDDRYRNNEKSLETVVFSASPCVERAAPAAWRKLNSDDQATVVLIADGQPVSNEQVILRVRR